MSAKSSGQYGEEAQPIPEESGSPPHSKGPGAGRAAPPRKRKLSVATASEMSIRRSAFASAASAQLEGGDPLKAC
jgi:hypothetical protein